MDLELMSQINQGIYLFGAGILVGKFTGPLSTLVIGASTLYYFYPDVYTYETYILFKNSTEIILNNISLLKSR